MLQIIGDRLHVRTYRTRTTSQFHLWGCSLIPVTVSDLKAVFRCVPARLVIGPSLCVFLSLNEWRKEKSVGRWGTCFSVLILCMWGDASCKFHPTYCLIFLAGNRPASYPNCLGFSSWVCLLGCTWWSDRMCRFCSLKETKKKRKSPCHMLGMVPNIAQRHYSVT